MLCEVQYDEEMQVAAVGPAAVPNARCAFACCVRTVQLQIRTRQAYGRAVMCAAYLDGGVYHTEFTSVRVTELWRTFPLPATKIRDCTVTEEYNTGLSAIWTTGDPGAVTDCGGEEPVITVDPADCFDGETSEWDDPRPQPPTFTYGGDSAAQDELLDEAISAMQWGEWSEWSTVGVISATGNASLASLGLYLAEAGRGSSGEGAGSFATATRYESELRVVGEFAVSVSIASGSGLLPELTVTPQILTPGVPVLFSVDAPSSADGWETDAHVLRCACPARYAPSA